LVRLTTRSDGWRLRWGVRSIARLRGVLPETQSSAAYSADPNAAWLFAASYAAVELYLGVTGTQAGVAHFAHLGGMVGGGIVLCRWYQPRGRR